MSAGPSETAPDPNPDHLDIDALIAQVLAAGKPPVRQELGLAWAHFRGWVERLLELFESTMCVETRRDGSGAPLYIQARREFDGVLIEAVSNEFLTGRQVLAPDAVRTMIELDWTVPSREGSPNFERFYPEVVPACVIANDIANTFALAYGVSPNTSWAVGPVELVERAGMEYTPLWVPFEESTPGSTADFVVEAAEFEVEDDLAGLAVDPEGDLPSRNLWAHWLEVEFEPGDPWGDPSEVYLWFDEDDDRTIAGCHVTPFGFTWVGPQQSTVDCHARVIQADEEFDHPFERKGDPTPGYYLDRLRVIIAAGLEPGYRIQVRDGRLGRLPLGPLASLVAEVATSTGCDNLAIYAWPSGISRLFDGADLPSQLERAWWRNQVHPGELARRLSTLGCTNPSDLPSETIKTLVAADLEVVARSPNLSVEQIAAVLTADPLVDVPIVWAMLGYLTDDPGLPAQPRRYTLDVLDRLWLLRLLGKPVLIKDVTLPFDYVVYALGNSRSLAHLELLLDRPDCPSSFVERHLVEQPLVRQIINETRRLLLLHPALTRDSVRSVLNQASLEDLAILAARADVGEGDWAAAWTALLHRAPDNRQRILAHDGLPLSVRDVVLAAANSTTSLNDLLTLARRKDDASVAAAERLLAVYLELPPDAQLQIASMNLVTPELFDATITSDRDPAVLGVVLRGSEGPLDAVMRALEDEDATVRYEALDNLRRRHAVVDPAMITAAATRPVHFRPSIWHVKEFGLRTLTDVAAELLQATRWVAKEDVLTSTDELASILKTWLQESSAATIGDASRFSGRPWLRLELSGTKAVLNADTTRAAAERFVAHANSQAVDWHVQPNRSGRINKLVYSPAMNTAGWYCYLTTPMARAGRL